ncbi:arylsulfatase A family protein [Galbibacter orientalis DSM 19592]|uniref:Arylsulfatase A family protein n=2 Tax=Galbibacter TaxID=379068 RepID=I3CAX5_9FLAO|nr:arylsulfatase A family protein [Galbibacter orientalis DSM 19592]
MIKTICSITLYFLCFLSVSAQMNILFIESDDQSNQTVGAFGNNDIFTPNIDILAKEGVSFISAYNMGCWSPAVCIPSRTMLMYGKYLWESQKINKNNAPKSLPELLSENGYYTFITGKWHALGKPVKAIFNEVGSIQPGQLKTYNSPSGHITDITGSEAVKFINNYNNDKPFFAYVSFNSPHVPRQTAQNYYDLYPIENITLPPSVKDNSLLNPNVRYQYAPNPLQLKTMLERVQQNNAMVTHMDKQIGDILKSLKDKGIYDNTIIVFTSDHGINFGENGVAGKVCLYEPSVTAPLIIRAPNLEAGTTISERVYLQDIFPTLFDLLNLKMNYHTDFQSLIPLIEKKDKARKSIYLAMFDDQRGIISKNDKLIIYPKTGDLELYNLKNNPWETKNLVTKITSKSTIRELLKQLRMWQEKTKDQTDLTTIYKKYDL